MKRYTILLLIVLPVISNGQFKNLTLKISGNTTFINSATSHAQVQGLPLGNASGYTSIYVNTGTIKESYQSKPGFDIGVHFLLLEKNKFFIRSGLDIQLIRFHRKVSVELLENPINSIVPAEFGSIVGTPYGMLYGSSWPRNPDGSLVINPDGSQLYPVGQAIGGNPDLGKTTAVYLRLPVQFGYSFFSDKLTVGAGIQAQLLTYSAVVKEKYSNGSIIEYKDKSSDDFKNILLAVGTEGTWRIFKPLAVSLGYLRSLTPIYDSESQVGDKTFYNTISLGLILQL